ncbi:LppA family lipoprotein [Kineosporia babensis]|uniref:LppA family lipoprotein n=1 Tax=Kineosporia babensis TaxID=499548 RepID=A0A9X1SY80_9ACTN|nr:LppA family lipoprotein [Kineosporia babensis]MCD5316045.1 LppA family lipoprotein [Kineosporia babensis]
MSRVGAVKLFGAALVMLVLTGALAGCGGSVLGTSLDEAREELQARPSFEQAEKDYRALLKEVQDAVSELAPNVRWNSDEITQIGLSFCSRPYADVKGAESAIYTAGNGGVGAPSDEVWPEVKAKVSAIAEQYGFTVGGSLKDEPGNAMLVLRDSTGASLKLGFVENTTLSVYGSCALHEN